MISDIIKQYYWGFVFNEIAKDFSQVDSNREARFYVRKFCKEYGDILIT